MHLLLDVERRRLDDQVGPVLLVLAAPDELRVEVAVAPVIGEPDRCLVLLVHDRLELGRRDIAALVLVPQRLDRNVLTACHVLPCPLSLDQRSASFETAAARPPQDEDLSLMPSRTYLMLRSASQERVSKHARP